VACISYKAGRLVTQCGPARGHERVHNCRRGLPTSYSTSPVPPALEPRWTVFHVMALIRRDLHLSELARTNYYLNCDLHYETMFSFTWSLRVWSNNSANFQISYINLLQSFLTVGLSLRTVNRINCRWQLQKSHEGLYAARIYTDLLWQQSRSDIQIFMLNSRVTRNETGLCVKMLTYYGYYTWSDQLSRLSRVVWRSPSNVSAKAAVAIFRVNVTYRLADCSVDHFPIQPLRSWYWALSRLFIRLWRHGNGKVKLSPCLIKHYATKAYGGVDI
jgi:hypothetical protein